MVIFNSVIEKNLAEELLPLFAQLFVGQPNLSDQFWRVDISGPSSLSALVKEACNRFPHEPFYLLSLMKALVTHQESANKVYVQCVRG